VSNKKETSGACITTTKLMLVAQRITQPNHVIHNIV
jgi:hypothetical protein